MTDEEQPAQTLQKGPERHSPRVQSWIRTVLNPLIEAVEYEIPLLERGSLTWHFYDRSPDRVKQFASYVSDSRRALEDLLRSRPYMQAPLAQHDVHLKAAVDRAAYAHDWLLAQSDFVALVTARLADYYATRDRVIQRPSGSFSEDKLPGLVADRLINNDRDVGFPYTDADFWNVNRQAFMAHTSGAAFGALRSAVENFCQYDRTLLEQLKKWHYDLLEEFDVEPV